MYSHRVPCHPLVECNLGYSSMSVEEKMSHTSEKEWIRKRMCQYAVDGVVDG